MPVSVDVVDWNQLRAFRELQVEGEADLLGQIVRMFREEGPARLARAQAALERGDCVTVRLEAHSLRGTAGLIGASVLLGLATEVERVAEAGDTEAAGAGLAGLESAMDDVLAALTEAVSV